MPSTKQVSSFRRAVWNNYNKDGRHDLPWRNTTDAYQILVSEVMLQQTQVPRVIEKYKSFLKRFPTVRALAKAPLAHVLKEWNGLGYNRRGKYLHDAAKKIAGEYRGDVQEALRHPLPGVGPYTRAAVAVFAFNEPDTLIETNIRTALIHHFFPSPHTLQISDRQLLAYAAEAARGQDPRRWHWALMDYGAELKRSGVRTNARSKHYTKQSKFEGSLRQVRGTILRELHQKPSALRSLPFATVRTSAALAGLERDGLVKKEKGKWRIA